MPWEFEDTIATDKTPEEQQSPWTFEEEEKKPQSNALRDTVSEELRKRGYEPDFSEELERLSEKGIAEGYRGVFSGATLGASEHIPGLKPEQNVASTSGKIAGSLLPIEGLLKIFGPLAKVAAKSPVLAKPLTSLARITGVGLTGASYEGLTKAVKGEVPSVDDLVNHGAEWALLDAGLNLLGAGGKFAASLLKKSKSTSRSPHKVLNDIFNQIREQGGDVSTPERVAAKAMSILEEPAAKATKGIQLPTKKGPSTIEETARARIEGQPTSSGARPIELPSKQGTSTTEQIAQRKLTPVQEVAKDLGERKVESQQFDQLRENEIAFAGEYKPESFSFEEAAKDLETSDIDKLINETFPQKIREQDLGKMVQEGIETSLDDARAIYAPLYDEAREAASYINITPMTVASRATEIMQSLEKLKTRPAGYQSVINTIENVLEDLGFVIERSPEGKFLNAHAPEGSAQASTLMELGKRLNEIVDYDILDSSIKDRLKPIVNAIKADTRAALAGHEEALNAYETAENLYGATAEQFNQAPIRKMRQLEQPEKITSELISPSSLEMLKKTLPEEQMRAVERQVLEEMKDLNYLQARKLQKELSPHLSEDADYLAKEIVNSKLPVGSPAKTKDLQNKVLNDISNAMVTGERPSKALNLWKTKEGHSLIKDLLKDNKNADQIIKYLEDQSFYDYSAQYIGKDGKIDFKKFKQQLKDKDFKANLQRIGGTEAVTFFNQIENRLNGFERLLITLDKLPPKLDSPRGKHLIQKAREKAQEIPRVPKYAQEKLQAIEHKPKVVIGKEKIQRAKEKAAQLPKEQVIAQERIPTLKKTPKTELAKEKLKTVAARNFPLETKIKAFLDFLGPTGKAALTTFGFLKFGLPTVIALGGYKMMYQLAKNPRMRMAFKIAMKKNPKDFTQLINGWTQLEKELDKMN